MTKLRVAPFPSFEEYESLPQPGEVQYSVERIDVPADDHAAVVADVQRETMFYSDRVAVSPQAWQVKGGEALGDLLQRLKTVQQREAEASTARYLSRATLFSLPASQRDAKSPAWTDFRLETRRATDGTTMVYVCTGGNEKRAFTQDQMRTHMQAWADAANQLPQRHPSVAY